MPDGPDGPASAGVAHINKYGKEHFGGCMKCVWLPDKGRILHSTRDYALGEIILVEAPLHIVQEDPKGPAFLKLRKFCKQYADEFDYDPLWYWCALQSLTEEHLSGAKEKGLTGASAEVMHNLLLLHHEEVSEPSAASEKLVAELIPNADPIILERLIQIWVLNCFEYSDDPQGYSTYFYSSFMSHSCFPNAIWHYDGPNHVLRARRVIQKGDEVCISYLPEDGLLQAAPVRRWELHETKRFWCTCERCAGDKDYSRGHRCKSCHEGTVFANVPKRGAAKSAALLASELAGAVCDSCGKQMTKAKAEEAAAQEAEVAERVQAIASGSTKLNAKSAQELDALVASSFMQHVLADLVREQLVEFYSSKKNRSEQQRLLAQRRLFHKGSYDGLSGAHAWTLEAFGDAILAGAGDGSVKLQKADWEAAREIYTEAKGILTLMFGDKHEYVTQVVDKIEGLGVFHTTANF